MTQPIWHYFSTVALRTYNINDWFLICGNLRNLRIKNIIIHRTNTLLKANTKTKIGIKDKRAKAGLNDEYLIYVAGVK